MKRLVFEKNIAGKLELHCPHCHEELESSDVENFSCCPYCGEVLPRSEALEDFVMDPMIRRWLRQNPMFR